MLSHEVPTNVITLVIMNITFFFKYSIDIHATEINFNFEIKIYF